MTVPKRWGCVHSSVEEFRDTYLHTSFQTLTIVEGWDGARDYDGDYKMLKAVRPFHERGVYLIFDADGLLLYVGSTINRFDSRIWHYAFENQRHIDLICFDPSHVHFAPALELFLIARCKPRYNTVGGRLAP